MALSKSTANIPFVKRFPAGSDREADAGANWTPNTDVYLTDGGLVIKVELAGLRKEDLEITIEQTRLRIHGLRRDGCRGAQCRFIVMETNYGPFETVIEVPPGYDLGSAKAAYQNGFLRVDVPLAPAQSSTPFSIPIEAEKR
jgi:HSP20 family protein